MAGTKGGTLKLERLNPIHRTCVVMCIIGMSCSIWSVTVVTSQLMAPASPTTNPVDLQVLHEMMYAMYYEYDWATQVPDPCVSSPQGIICEADPVTGVLFVTQMQFGFISPIANIIPCSANASIPASIANLTRLTSLAFYSCFTNQTTTLPPELFLLGPSLRLLSFTQNPALSGPLPAGIAHLTGLQRMVLSQNSLHGPIPFELTTLPSLAQLDLSHNQFSGAIPPTFGAMDSLINLDLRYNALDGEFPVSLAQEAHNLQRLALSHNNLSGALPDTFTGLQSLTFLDLSSNELTGALPPSLGTLTHLEDLFLNNNRYNSAIPESITELKSLVRLDLSSCAFVGLIPSSLNHLESLRFFSVSNNRLSGPIPSSLASLPVLFTLNLDGNELTGPVPFPASFVQKMGRNLQLKENAGLCYSPQLVIIKLLLPGLKQCPESVLVPDTTTAPPPSKDSPSPGSSQLPNAAPPAHPSDASPARIFVAASILCFLSMST
ncbi:hypothetical protein M758_12G082200 [Ceratodon purpureus]|nr:hypothetical protein M758_12G082200 [Ceratodon purpureus]